MEQHRTLFPGHREGEHVIVILRHHWIIWFNFLGQLTFFNLLPIGMYFFAFTALNWNLSTDTPLFVVAVLFTSFYYLGTWLMYFHQFVDYRLDVWILTDQRIVSIEQQGLFDRVISELNINRVQDVTSELRGKLQTVLDYGNVYIQSAGERQRFVFTNIPHPEEVARLITHANDEAIRQQAIEVHAAIEANHDDEIHAI